MELEYCSILAKQHQDVVPERDPRDLVCELADTATELGDPQRAERHIRQQFARREGLALGRQLSGRSFASLANALFAQHQAAETVCSTAKDRQGLQKLGNLRLSITRSKLCHLRSDFAGSVQHWGDGIKLLGQFPSGTIKLPRHSWRREEARRYRRVARVARLASDSMPGHVVD